ncbi:hypothetical protein ACJMK2_014084, partial [Sinanodonta woodiana]
HAFMKDTDNVLITLDRIGAEDKCLMLIRKPKSASKQMLKAHSWANLSFPEPHLQCLDGTFKGDTVRHQKHRGKRKPFDSNYGSCKGSDVGTSTYSSVSEGLFTVREQKEYPLSQEMNSLSNSGKYCPPEPQQSPSALKSKSDLQIHQNFEVTDKKKNLAKFFSLYSAKKKNIDVLESRNKNRKTENYSLGSCSQTLDKRDVSSVSTKQNDSAVRNHNGRIANDEFYETGFRSEASMPKSQKLDSGFSSSTEKPRVPTANWSETDKPILRQHVSSKSHKSRTMELDKNSNSAFHPNYAKSDKSVVFEENTEGDPFSRSHSLVDLTSGLTFSLVGQKKADSVQRLPTNTTNMDKPNNQRDLIGNIPKNNENSCNNKRFMSLQNLSACINNLDEKQISSGKFDEKRPRRLPEVPCGVDINEKRKQVSDFMKMRMTLSSRASLSPRSISTSNNSSSRQGGVSITPSDREVSALLAADKTLQNNASSSLDLCNLNLTDENQAYPLQVTQKHTPLSQSVRSSGSFNSQDHSMNCFSRVPSSGMSESGLTTLTSQSTVDSGYITNDAESDVPSTSNYARSLKQSAQNFYTSNKYFKSAVPHNNKPSADTRTWIEKQVSQPNMENRASNTLPRMTSYSMTDNSLSTPGAESSAECLVLEKDKTSTFRSTQPQASNLHRKGISNSMSFGLNTTGSDSGFKLSNFQNCPVGSLQDLSKHRPFVYNEHFQKGSEISEADPLSKTWPEGIKFSGNNKQSNYTTRSSRKPSLFQILQIYELCLVRLKLPDNVAIFDLIKLIECEVMLPSPWSENKHSDRTVSSPKGNHAMLGGPGSAFKPVKSGNSSLAPITMVTVVQISSKLADYCDKGNIMKGDLIVEVGLKKNGVPISDC